MDYNNERLTHDIIKCIIRVHGVPGPGFLESIYRKSLMTEFGIKGIKAETEVVIPVYYQNIEVGTHRLDILVENEVILELKTVECLDSVHYAQLRSYMKATGLATGFLVNFSRAKADFRRIEIP